MTAVAARRGKDASTPDDHTIPTSTPTRQFYRPKEACDVLRIGMATLYRRIRAGDIRASKLGGATLISHAEIERVTSSGRKFVPSTVPSI